MGIDGCGLQVDMPLPDEKYAFQCWFALRCSHLFLYCTYMVLKSIVTRAESNATGVKDVFLAVGGRVFCVTLG